MEEPYIDAPEYDVLSGRPVNQRTIRLREQKELTYVRRGMGKSGITHRSMTDAERMTICMLCGQGLSYDEIGEKVKRSAATVRGVIYQAKKAASAAGLHYDWREDLKQKSIQAIRAGLDHNKDPYKAAGIGVQTMKGLGEFENEGRIQIATLLNSIPENQRDRYVSLETAGAIEIEGGEVPEPAPVEIPFEDEPKVEPPTVEDPEPVEEPEVIPEP